MAGQAEGALYYVDSSSILRRKGTMGHRLTRAYNEGREADAAGALQNTNPHTSGTPEYLSWDAGWVAHNTPTAGTQFETAVA
jgi:hypothetical protein